MRGTLAFLMAAAIPFPTLGPALAEDTTLSPALAFGLLWGLLSLRLPHVTRSQAAAALMLFVFLLTAVGRHEPQSYLLSLAALALAVIPFTTPVRDERTRAALIAGFLAGLAVTSLIMLAEVGASVLGLTRLLDALDAAFPGGRRGLVFLIPRPKAGFFEPSHLTIYLCYAFVVADQLRDRLRRAFEIRLLCAALVFLSTSLTGILLLAAYLAAAWPLRALAPGGLRLSARRAPGALLRLGAALLLLAALAWTYREVLLLYGDRLATALTALETGQLVGSEASRVNAFAPLLAYWSEAGPAGLLFGTGYANASGWLIERFGAIGVFASAGRGHLDNLLAAVLLSTGLFGTAFYLGLLVLRFGVVPASRRLALAVFVLAVHFAYGHLTSYLNWYLMAVLAQAAVAAGRRAAPSPAPAPDPAAATPAAGAGGRA